MFSRFIYLREDRKFFIVAAVISALVLIAVIATSMGLCGPDIKYNDWAELASNVR